MAFDMASWTNHNFAEMNQRASQYHHHPYRDQPAVTDENFTSLTNANEDQSASRYPLHVWPSTQLPAQHSQESVENQHSITPISWLPSVQNIPALCWVGQGHAHTHARAENDLFPGTAHANGYGGSQSNMQGFFHGSGGYVVSSADDCPSITSYGQQSAYPRFANLDMNNTSPAVTSHTRGDVPGRCAPMVLNMRSSQWDGDCGVGRQAHLSHGFGCGCRGYLGSFLDPYSVPQESCSSYSTSDTSSGLSPETALQRSESPREEIEEALPACISSSRGSGQSGQRTTPCGVGKQEGVVASKVKEPSPRKKKLTEKPTKDADAGNVTTAAEKEMANKLKTQIKVGPKRKNSKWTPEMIAFLVQKREEKVPYKRIKKLGGFECDEATLRGRYRNHTKTPQERPRKPRWTENDVELLKQAVQALGKPKTRRKQAAERAATVIEIKWKDVAEHIVAHGGSLLFGATVCKLKWDEVKDKCLPT